MFQEDDEKAKALAAKQDTITSINSPSLGEAQEEFFSNMLAAGVDELSNSLSSLQPVENDPSDTMSSLVDTAPEKEDTVSIHAWSAVDKAQQEFFSTMSSAGVDDLSDVTLKLDSPSSDLALCVATIPGARGPGTTVESKGQREKSHLHDKQDLTATNLVPDDDSMELPSTINDNTPLPVLQRHRRQRESTPGAFAYEGPSPSLEHNHRLESQGQGDEYTSSRGLSVDVDHGLAVANLVADEDPEAIPQATEDDSSVTNRKREQSIKQFKTRILLGVILCAVVVALVAVFVPAKNSKVEEVMVTAQPSSSPTQASTSFDSYLLSLFPEETIVAFEHVESPQARAFQWLLEDPSLAYISDERIKQKFVLATLHFATNGENWANSKNWLDHSVHECNWYQTSSFIMKDLLQTMYPGFLANFLPQTPANCGDDGILHHLWLDQNNLAGTLPDELCLLTSLQTLSIVFNQCSGTIPTLIGQLTCLEGLGIGDLQAKGGSSIPSEIGLMSNLKALFLTRNGHEGLIPTELWQLTKLEYFSLTSNPLLQGTIPTEIGRFTSLSWFITHGSNLSGSIPTEFGLLRSITTTSMYGNQFTGSIPSEFGQLPQLETFSWYGNFLSGTLPTELGLISTLFLFTARDNHLSGPIPSELGLLTNLEINLNLRNNGLLSGFIPSELGLLTMVHEIELLGNELTGTIPSEFGGLTAMGKLSLANNYLSGSIPQELSALQHSLFSFQLEGNPALTGEVPGALCGLNATCIGSVHDPCEGPTGLSFDCSSTLFGCNCSYG